MTSYPEAAAYRDALLAALNAVVHAAARDEALPILNSVAIEATPARRGKPATLRVVACDNYRIAWADVGGEVVVTGKPPTPLVLPLAEAQRLVTLLKSTGSYSPLVTLAAGPSGLIVTVGPTSSMTAALRDGQYPNYAQFLPGGRMNRTRKRHRVGVTGTYLAEVAKAFTSPPGKRRETAPAATLVVELPADPTAPILLYPQGRADVGEVLMPVRLAGTRPV